MAFQDRFIQDLSKLTYRERATVASTLNKTINSVDAENFAKQLLTHPVGTGPEIVTEEGFTDVLPAPSADISKCYHSHFAGLQIAASTRATSLLVSEVKSNSQMFKQFAINHVVKQTKEDADLEKLIFESVPNVKLKLLHTCIKERRVALLDRILPSLLKTHGIDFVAGILHGCSQQVVQTQMANAEMRKSNNLRWAKLCHSHSSVVLGFLQQSLQAEKDGQWYSFDEIAQKKDQVIGVSYLKAWSYWESWLRSQHALDDLIFKAGRSSALLDLLFAFPCYSHLPYWPFSDKIQDPLKEVNHCFVLPALPHVFSENYAHFVKRHPKELAAWLKDSVRETVFEVIQFDSTVESVWNSSIPLLPFSEVYEILKHIASCATPNSFYQTQHWDLRTSATAERIPIFNVQFSYVTTKRNYELSQLQKAIKDYLGQFGQATIVFAVTNTGTITFDLPEIKTEESSMEDGKMVTGANKLWQACQKDDQGSFFTVLNTRINLKINWGLAHSGHFPPHLDRVTFSRDAPYWDSLTTWSRNQVNKVINLGFDTLDRLRDVESAVGATENYNYRGFYIKACVDFGFRAIESLTNGLKAPAPEIRIKTGWENKYFECIMLVFDRLVKCLLWAREGYMERLELLQSLVQDVNRALKNNSTNHRLSPRQEDYSAVFAFALNGNVRKSWQEVKERLTTKENWEIPLKSVLSSLTKRLTNEANEVNVFYSNIVKLLALVNADKLSAVQAEAAIKRSLELLVSIRPRVDYDLDLWKLECVDKFWIKCTNKAGQKGGFAHRLHIILDSKISLLQSPSWRSSWRLNFPTVQAQLAQLVRDVSSHVDAQMRNYPLESNLKDTIPVLNRRYAKECLTKSTVEEAFVREITELIGLAEQPTDIREILPPNAVPNVIARVCEFLNQYIRDGVNYPWWQVSFLAQLRNSLTSRLEIESDAALSTDLSLLRTIVAAATDTDLPAKQTEKVVGFVISQIEGLQPAVFTEQWQALALKFYKHMFTKFTPTLFPFPDEDAKITEQRKFDLTMLNIIMVHWTKLLQGRWRRGLDDEVNHLRVVDAKVQQLLAEVSTNRQAEKVRMREARRQAASQQGIDFFNIEALQLENDKKEERPEDDFDRALQLLLRSLAVAVSPSTAAEKVQRAWSTLESFMQANLTAQNKHKYALARGEAWSSACFAPLQQLANAVATCLRRAVTHVATSDIGILETLMGIMTPMHLHPMCTLFMFDNLLPTFTSASPPITDVVDREKAAARARWDSAIQEFVLDMVALLEKYKGKATKRIERDRNILIEMQRKKADNDGNVAMADDKKEADDGYPDVSTISDNQIRIATQTVKTFAPVSAHHISFLTTLLEKVPFESDESFASCYELIAQGQPVENLPHLVKLLLQVGKSNNDARWELVFRSFRLIPEPIRHLPHLLEVLQRSSPTQQLIVFKSFEIAHLLQLSYSNPSTLISLFDALHVDPSRILPETRAYVSEVLVTLLPQVSSETRDQLLKYQDINLCRKALELGTNSNSWSQRLAGLRDLLHTSQLCSEKRHDNLLKTLKFFSKKIKNESPENREQALSLLLEDSAVPSWLSNTEYLPILLDILSDCLESLDVGKLTESLGAFVAFSKNAIDVGAADAGGELFKFGVEVQWRICLHRLGDLKASQQFRIAISSLLRDRGSSTARTKVLFDSDRNAQFVTGWLQAYKDRIEERAPDWLTGPQNSFPYLQPLVSILGNELESVDEIQKFLNESIAYFENIHVIEDEAVMIEALSNTSTFFFAALKHFRDWREFKALPRLISALCTLWTTLNAETAKNIAKDQPEVKKVVKSSDKARKNREARYDKDEVSIRFDVSEKVGSLLYKLFSSCVTHTEAIENVKKRYNRFYIPVEWQDHIELNQMAAQFLKLIKGAVPRTVAFPSHTSLEREFMLGPIAALWKSKRTKWFKCDLLQKYVNTLAAVVEGLNLSDSSQSFCMQTHARTVFMNLMKWQPKCWWLQASAARLCRAFTRVLQSCPEHDSDGLLLLNSDNEIINMFEDVFRINRYARKNWLSIPPLNEYVNVVLRSRQAGVMVWRWFGAHSHDAKTPAKRFASRDSCVSELLSISKSAVHLRIVWRHLTSSRQDLLEKYLNPNDPFYGVFFVEPSVRTASGGNASESSDLVADSRKSKSKTQKTGGRSVQCVRDAKRAFDEEADRVQALELARTDWLAKNSNAKSEAKTYVPQFDHEDLFRLPTYFHLKRLLPEQCLKLGQQVISEGLNKDRPQTSRKEALARWTMLPSTTYSSIIVFLKEVADQKLPRNLVEVLTRGCMCNDDMIAPLHYLLSPALLSSDSAKVAAYAISSCIPRIPESVFTKIIENLLSKGRRHTLKVTVVKEIVRLLIKFPTAKNISMMIREWRRPSLHRDVRITILKAAFKFLEVSREVKNAQSAAWQIFDSAVQQGTDLEVLTSIVCAHPASSHCAISGTKLQGLTTTPRILDHLDTLSLSERSVQLRHCAQFGRQVILPLIERGITPPTPAILAAVMEDEKSQEEGDVEMVTIRTTASEDVDDADMVLVSADGKTEEKAKESKQENNKESKEAKDAKKEKEAKEAMVKRNEDVAFIAIAVLPQWAVHGLQRESAEVLKKVIVDFSPNVVNNKSKDIQKINDKRWRLAVKGLFRICGITSKIVWPPEAGNRITFVVEVFQAIISHLVALPIEERDTRCLLLERVKWMTEQLPEKFTQMYSMEDELSLMKALEEHDLFWSFITRREVTRLTEPSIWNDDEKFNAPVANFLIRSLMKACENPMLVSEIKSLRESLFLASRPCPSALISAFLSGRFVWVSEDTMQKATKMPSFHCRVYEVAFSLLDLYPTYADESPTNLQLTSAFFGNSFFTVLSWFKTQHPSTTPRVSYNDLFSTFVKLCTKTSVASARELILTLPTQFFLRPPSQQDDALQRAMLFAMVQSLLRDEGSLLLRLIPDKLVEIIREVVISLPSRVTQENSLFAIKPLSLENLANIIGKMATELKNALPKRHPSVVPPLAIAIFESIKREAFNNSLFSPEFQKLVILLITETGTMFLPTLDTLGLRLNWGVSDVKENEREKLITQNMEICVRHVKGYFEAYCSEEANRLLFRELVLPNNAQHSAIFPLERRLQLASLLLDRCPVLCIWASTELDAMFQLSSQVKLQYVNATDKALKRAERFADAAKDTYQTVLTVITQLDPRINKKDPVAPAVIAIASAVLQKGHEFKMPTCDSPILPFTSGMFWFEVADRLLFESSARLCEILALSTEGRDLIHTQCIRHFEWLQYKHNAHCVAVSKKIPFQPSMSCFKPLYSAFEAVLGTSTSIRIFFKKLTHHLVINASTQTEVALELASDSIMLSSMDINDMISLQSYLLTCVDKTYVPRIASAIVTQISTLQPDWRTERELSAQSCKIVAHALQLPSKQTSDVEVNNRRILRREMVLFAPQLIALAQSNRFDALLREALLGDHKSLPSTFASAINNFVLILTPFLTQHQTMHSVSVKLLLDLVAFALGDVQPDTSDIVLASEQDETPTVRYRALLCALLAAWPHLIVYAALVDGGEDGRAVALLVRLVGMEITTSAWKQGLGAIKPADSSSGLATTFVRTLTEIKAPLGEPCSPICKGNAACVGCLYALGKEVPISAPRGDPLLQEGKRMAEGYILGVYARRFLSAFIAELNHIYGDEIGCKGSMREGVYYITTCNNLLVQYPQLSVVALDSFVSAVTTMATWEDLVQFRRKSTELMFALEAGCEWLCSLEKLQQAEDEKRKLLPGAEEKVDAGSKRQRSSEPKYSLDLIAHITRVVETLLAKAAAYGQINHAAVAVTAELRSLALSFLQRVGDQSLQYSTDLDHRKDWHPQLTALLARFHSDPDQTIRLQALQIKASSSGSKRGLGQKRGRSRSRSRSYGRSHSSSSSSSRSRSRNPSISPPHAIRSLATARPSNRRGGGRGMRGRPRDTKRASGSGRGGANGSIRVRGSGRGGTRGSGRGGRGSGRGRDILKAVQPPGHDWGRNWGLPAESGRGFGRIRARFD